MTDNAIRHCIIRRVHDRKRVDQTIAFVCRGLCKALFSLCRVTTLANMAQVRSRVDGNPYWIRNL